MTPTLELISQTKELLHAVRGSLIHVARNLHIIRESNEWQGHASSWSEFCESILEIPQSQASKLLGIHQHYIIDGGKDIEDLIGLDYEKAYSARKLPGTVDEQLAKARTLSRTELKHEANDAEVIPHAFEEVCYCRVCGLSKANHP
jgi:hypothetical protein